MKFKPTAEYKHLEKELEEVEKSVKGILVSQWTKNMMDTYQSRKYSLISKMNQIFDAQTT